MDWINTGIYIFITVITLMILISLFLYYSTYFQWWEIREREQIMSNNGIYTFNQEQKNTKNTTYDIATCKRTCPERICRQFADRMSAFDSCKKCKQQQLCYSQPQNSCIRCAPQDEKRSCEDAEYLGCTNPKSFQLPDVSPIPPEQYGCRLCF